MSKFHLKENDSVYFPSKGCGLYLLKDDLYNPKSFVAINSAGDIVQIGIKI